MITIRDVAKRANMSLSTVSRVVRGEANVNEKTRAIVLEAMRALRYQPNQAARTLRNKQSKTIGMIVSDVENYFYSIVLSRIEKEIKGYEYSMLLSYSNESEEEEKQCLDLMLRAQVDGLIYTPVSAKNEEQINALAAQGIAVLQLYRCAHQTIDSLVVGDTHGVYIGTKHLLAMGHHRILLLDAITNISPSREDGFQLAMNESAKKMDSAAVLRLPLKGQNENAILQRLKSYQPTALIAGTNTFGYEAVRACRALNLKIPADISVIVQDDVSWVPLMGFSAISQPMEKIATTAVEMLFSRLKSEPEDRENVFRSVHMELEPSLIMRQSVLDQNDRNAQGKR